MLKQLVPVTWAIAPQPISTKWTRPFVFERVGGMPPLPDIIVKYRTHCLVSCGPDRKDRARLHHGPSERPGRVEDGDRELLRPGAEDLQRAEHPSRGGGPGRMPSLSHGDASRIQRGRRASDAPEEPDRNAHEGRDDYRRGGSRCPAAPWGRRRGAARREPRVPPHPSVPRDRDYRR